MKCRKCHVTISNVAKYCPRCGELFDNGDVEKIGNTLENRLLSYYIDENSGSNIRFSIYYLIFNFSYLFYLKMYKHGICSFFATLIFSKLVGNILKSFFVGTGFYFLAILFIFLTSLAVNIYYLFNVQTLYFSNCKYRVQRIIKMLGSNNTKVLDRVCISDSKNSISLALISIIAFLIVIFL